MNGPDRVELGVELGRLALASPILTASGTFGHGAEAGKAIGLGDPAVISWGKMLSVGQTYLLKAWWLSVFPGLAIFLTVLACNLLGDGLGGYLNPRDRARFAHCLDSRLLGRA